MSGIVTGSQDTARNRETWLLFIIFQCKEVDSMPINNKHGKNQISKVENLTHKFSIGTKS